MQRRHQHINVPTEIVRTIAAIAQTGSFSKAGDKLGLSQPAISAQMKLVGGAVFDRVAGGVAFTPRGKAVLAFAHKLLEANDQMLSLGGAAQDIQPLRLGLAVPFVRPFFTTWDVNRSDIRVSFYCDHSAELAKGLLDGYIDVACLISPPPELDNTAVSWHEQYVWVRHKSFVLSPGAVIPIVIWPGSPVDLHVTKALEKAGMAYRVAFAGTDHGARVAAVGTGIGLTAMALRQVAEPLMIAEDYYLPPLEPLRAGVFAREGIDQKQVQPLIEALKTLAPQNCEAKRITPKPYAGSGAAAVLQVPLS